MLRALRLKNFKAFTDTGLMDVRPLTLLLGPNSSGKSTIVQSLLLLKQTAESRDLANPLVTHGEYLKLGEYRDYIHGHDRAKKLSLEITFDALISYPRLREFAPASPRVTLEVEFAYNKRMLRPVLQHAVADCYTTPPRRLEIRRAPNGKFVGTVGTEGEDEIRVPVDAMSKFYSPLFKFGRSPSRTRLLPGSIEDKTRFAAITWFDLGNSIEQLFRSIYYLGPLRDEPHRLYVATGERPGDVGLKGERSVDVLWHAFRRKATRETVLGPINQWMRRFGIAREVTLVRVGGNNYSVAVTDPASGLVVNLVDVGFGASQLLPLIVEGFTAQQGSTLLIEQPEIHLHPSAQSELGDLLLRIAETGKAVIAETHSEQLLRRIQRRVAEAPELRSKLAIYYCQPHPDGTELREIKFNDLGQLESDTVPPNFFEAGYADSRAFAEAMGRRAQE